MALQCPLTPAAVARLWQHRPQLVVLVGSGSGALNYLATLQQQQQRGQQGPGGAGGCISFSPLPPLEDVDGGRHRKDPRMGGLGR